MKFIHKLLVVSAVAMAAQAQAAVDVTGFSIGGGSFPYGLFAMVLLLAAVGLHQLRRNS